jgi:hypothetical protein
VPGTGNTAVGQQALVANTSASNNTAIGMSALLANTTGGKNTALGKGASQLNTTGYHQTSVGYHALNQCTTGQENTAVGYFSLTNATTGSNNVAVGVDAFRVLTTGIQNVAVGDRSGDSLTTGEKNTFIGRNAGATVTTGSGNVCVGSQSGAGETATNNQLWVARDATGVSNAATWIYGNAAGACYQGNNSSSWTTTSDERIKKDIVDSTNGLAKIDALQVRNFNYRTPEEITAEGITGCDAAGLQTGVIAQEIETVLPNAVTASQSGTKQVNTDPIFWSMVKAIQELSTKNDALEARITALEG